MRIVCGVCRHRAPIRLVGRTCSMPMQTEHDLWERVYCILQRGSADHWKPAEWGEIAQTLRTLAYRILQRRYARGWEPEDWEEMAQDAIFKVIVAVSKESVETARWRAWFYTIVEHIVRDRHRQQSGRHSQRTYV